jgi:hypothetical protein
MSKGAFRWSPAFRRCGELSRSEPRRLKVLKLRSGERGGVSPLIFLVRHSSQIFQGTGNDLIGDTLLQVRNTKNQGAYATPLAWPFTNSATSKPEGGTPTGAGLFPVCCTRRFHFGSAFEMSKKHRFSTSP